MPSRNQRSNFGELRDISQPATGIVTRLREVATAYHPRTFSGTSAYLALTGILDNNTYWQTQRLVIFAMSPTQKQTRAEENAVQIIRDRGGVVRTSEAVRAGIHPRTIYSLRDSGELEQLSRGVFRLSDKGSISQPDLVIVATRIPQAVVCLTSALVFHEITTQIPDKIFIALPKGAEQPRLDFPPLSIHRFSGPALVEGIEIHDIDGVKVRVYCPEKTLADCFRFRNRIGMDIVLEALKLYRARRRFNLSELVRYARLCRVETVMRPYLEALL